MHGLINRSLQYFVVDTAGQPVWDEIAEKADLGFQSFEAMLTYDMQITFDVLSVTAERLKKPQPTLLEDLGTYLVSHPSCEALRRLLRFSGETYIDFLNSLHELPDRARLAVSDLILPEIEVSVGEADRFELRCRSKHPEFSHVLVGVLRAMADDYGALVLLDLQDNPKIGLTISANVVETGFTEGRQFSLSSKHMGAAL
jgi:hypothetical protein